MIGHQSAFEQDVAAYLNVLPRLLSTDSGKYALVGGAQLVGVHTSHGAAMSGGYATFGFRGFLVQEISPHDLEMGQHWLQA
mgnify:FL=1